MLTLGSLFDGAGTIPFAAQLCGIQTLWSSEIEKYPCTVTSKRFPNVNQLGDIRTINGAEIEPVDIIAGGSPCQDLSVAGLRAGLECERSGLFMEQIRVIKEMRNATNKRANEPIRPRYAVWENVPGAFSSNKGEDFRIVLEEFCKVKDHDAHIPRPAQGGAGGILAEPSWVMGIPSHGEFSMRVFGESPNVAEESGLWQILEANVPQKYFLSARACVGVLRRAERRGKELPTILKTALEQQIERWEKYGTPLPVFDVSVVGVEGIDIYNATTTGKVSKTLNSAATDSDHIPCVCYDARGNRDGKTVPTITGDHNNRLTDYTAVCCMGIDGYNGQITEAVASTLGINCGLSSGRQGVLFAIDRAAFNQGENAKYNIGIDEKGTAFTVTAKGPGAVYYCLQGNGVDRADTAGCSGKGVKENECYTLNTVDRHAVCYGVSPDNSPSCDGVNLNEELSPTLQVHKKLGIYREAVEAQYIVRRLTPLECCRLQGMPDWWLDDVEGSDAARYKLWGNGMALPNALYIMEGIAQAESK